MFSQNYNVYLNNLEKCLTIPSSPPRLASEPKVSISSLPSYPLFQENCINIYTDVSKTNSGTGYAFVLFLSASVIEHGQCKLGDDNSVLSS